MSDSSTPVPIYFGGKVQEPVWKPIEEKVGTVQIFLHYLNTVWVNQHPVPTEAATLATFDVRTLIPEYRAFVQGGGRIPERGASLEEFWLGSQLTLRCPITCLLSTAQPEQEVARITRLRRLSAAEIWGLLKDVYANPALERLHPAIPARLNPIPTLVYDGEEIAHIINSWTIHEEELHFADPWPGRSLLCAEHNRGGVAARESELIQAGWRITRSEFERVVFAVYLHTLGDPPPRPVVELTEDERRAAEQQKALRNTLRALNPAGRKPIEGMQTISRLQFAARFNRVWEVKLAINEGDDLDAAGDDGNTALHIAAEKGYIEIVKLLAKHGANRSARNAQGKTPAQAATAEGNPVVAEYLTSLG